MERLIQNARSVPCQTNGKPNILPVFTVGASLTALAGTVLIDPMFKPFLQ